MKDELSHRREAELAQAKSIAVIAPPLLDEHLNVGSMQLILVFVTG